MSSLSLTLRQSLGESPASVGSGNGRFNVGRLDMRGIVPDRLAALSVDEIAELTVPCQARLVRLGDLFQIEDGPRARLLLRGDLSLADNVAAGMRDGVVVVEGSVGNALAADMRGGQVIVHGDAGDYVAAGMRAGYVDITGSAQDYCAGARPGTRRGMRGGVLRVGQSAGRFLGYRMRRGTVIVGGSIDQGCANSMIAGTIICSGPLAAPVGVGMHRGTLVKLAIEPPPLHSGFTRPEQIRLSFLYLLFDPLRAQLPAVDIDSLLKQPMWRSLGDRASDGKGEVLWLVAEPPREVII